MLAGSLSTFAQYPFLSFKQSESELGIKSEAGKQEKEKRDWERG